jgi:hypothetical protein
MQASTWKKRTRHEGKHSLRCLLDGYKHDVDPCIRRLLSRLFDHLPDGESELKQWCYKHDIIVRRVPRTVFKVAVLQDTIEKYLAKQCPLSIWQLLSLTHESLRSEIRQLTCNNVVSSVEPVFYIRTDTRQGYYPLKRDELQGVLFLSTIRHIRVYYAGSVLEYVADEEEEPCRMDIDGEQVTIPCVRYRDGIAFGLFWLK